MASDHARIHRSIWLDEDYLDLSIPAQWLYKALLSAPGLTYAGTLDWHPKKIVQRSRTATLDLVEAALAELQENLFVLYDADTDEVMIRTFARGDGLLNSPNMATAYARAFSLIGSRTLRSVAIYELHRLKKDKPELKGWASVASLMKFAGTDPREAYERLNAGRESGQEADLPDNTGTGIPAFSNERSYVY